MVVPCTPRQVNNDFEWSEEEFTTYFPPGTVIPIGKNTGQVNVGIRLPEATELGLPTSPSSYLPWVKGEFEVANVENYTYESESSYFPNVVTGNMVEGVLSTTVGRYDYSLDEVDGIDGYFTTDGVYLQDFCVRFFVPLDQ